MKTGAKYFPLFGPFWCHQDHHNSAPSQSPLFPSNSTIFFFQIYFLFSVSTLHDAIFFLISFYAYTFFFFFFFFLSTVFSLFIFYVLIFHASIHVSLGLVYLYEPTSLGNNFYLYLHNVSAWKKER